MKTPTQMLSLSPEDTRLIHTQGYLGPYAAVTPDEMARLRDRIDREVLPTQGPNPKKPLQCRHMDRRFLWDLCTAPPIIERISGLLGPDLVLWATYFFNKEPGGAEIPWHQDANYWPIEPPLNLSVWLAIDPVTVENACVQLIPGSHREVVPHIKSREGMAFGQEADPARVDASEAIDMQLKPGAFFLFNERLLHHSEPNRSERRRLGMTMRFTLPMVRVPDHDAPPLFPGHACLLARGEVRFGFNRLADPPTGDA